LQVKVPKEKEVAVIGVSVTGLTDKVVPVTWTLKGESRAFKAVTVEKLVWMAAKIVALLTVTVLVGDWLNP